FVDFDGEVQALGTEISETESIDSDSLSPVVQQGAAAVSVVDGGVDLEYRVVAEGPVHRRDMPVAEGGGQFDNKWSADHADGISGFDEVRIPRLDDGVTVDLGLQQRQVGHFAGIDDRGDNEA